MKNTREMTEDESFFKNKLVIYLLWPLCTLVSLFGYVELVIGWAFITLLCMLFLPALIPDIVLLVIAVPVFIMIYGIGMIMAHQTFIKKNGAYILPQAFLSCFVAAVMADVTIVIILSLLLHN